MKKVLLELKDLTIKFGGVTALNEVNLKIYEGEILALIGPNGAGKTTVFNVVTGVYAATSGVVIPKWCLTCDESVSSSSSVAITKWCLTCDESASSSSSVAITKWCLS